MKSVIVLVSLVAIALATPLRFQHLNNPQEAQILTQENKQSTGQYTYSYLTSDGSSRQETGEILNAGTEDEILVVTGSYSYAQEDGKIITVNYVADQDGFRII